MVLALCRRAGFAAKFHKHLKINGVSRRFSTWHPSCKIRISGAPAETIPPVPAPHPQPANLMLSWTLTFIIVALIAGVLGFGGLAGAAAGVAKVCFFIFLVLFLVSLIRGKKSA